MDRHNIITLALVSFLGGLSVTSTPISASAQDGGAIEICISRGLATLKSEETFEQRGKVLCDSAGVGGFPPHEIRHDETAVVSFVPSIGKRIVPESVRVKEISSSNGGYGNATVSEDERMVSVKIWCRGKGIGQGRAWEEITLSGKTVNNPGETEMLSIMRICLKDSNAFSGNNP
ncbi:hypothetical protein JCM17960_27050 [Magnetospira thiophila]